MAIEDSIIFQSSSNGMADMRLTIIPDGSFIFHMRTVPQPMTDEEEAIINVVGTWTKKDNWVRLSFIKDKPIIEAVFDSKFAGGNEFIIIDENTLG